MFSSLNELIYLFGQKGLNPARTCWISVSPVRTTPPISKAKQNSDVYDS